MLRVEFCLVCVPRTLYWYISGSKDVQNNTGIFTGHYSDYNNTIVAIVYVYVWILTE